MGWIRRWCSIPSHWLLGKRLQHAGPERRHKRQASKPVRFEMDMAPTDVVHAGRLHLDRLFSSLIDTAIKYSKANVTIRVRSRCTAGDWRLAAYGAR